MFYQTEHFSWCWETQQIYGWSGRQGEGVEEMLFTTEKISANPF